ncbi:MAG: hypothetical protein NVSMB2_22620 [Chloroflexota bacterium]
MVCVVLEDDGAPSALVELAAGADVLAAGAQATVTLSDASTSVAQKRMRGPSDAIVGSDSTT